MKYTYEELELRLSDALQQLDVQSARSNALAAESAAKTEFIQYCFRTAADGCSLDGADIQELGERLGLFSRETYQPALHGYICGHEAGEDSVYVMKESPATDAWVNEQRTVAYNDLCAAFVMHRTTAGLDDSDKVTVKEATDALLHCAAQLRGSENVPVERLLLNKLRDGRA